MENDDDLTDLGPTPHESIQEANARGVVVVDASAPPAGGTPESDDGDSQTDTQRGEPIALSSGCYVESWLDFSLRGTIDLDCYRVYRPDRGLDGPLGRDRTSLFDATFTVTADNRLLFRDEQGRRIVFPRPFNFLASRNKKHLHLRLKAPWLKELHLLDGRLTKRFAQGKGGVYRLMSIEDANGNRLDLQRSNDGLLTRAEHSDGFAIAFINDAAGLRTAATLIGRGADLRLADYAYDRSRHLISAQCSTTFSVAYFYDGDERLAKWADASGRSQCVFDYDAAGRVSGTRTTGPWNGDRFEYGADDRHVSYRRGDGSREDLVLDEDGNLLESKNGLGAIERCGYDDGYCVTSTDPFGNVQHRSYDEYGNLSAIGDGRGRPRILRWSARGLLAVSIDGINGVRRFERDRAGNLVTAIDPLKRKARYTWTDAGRLASVHRADGTSETYRYDAHHRLVEVEDAAGGLTLYRRDDPFGRVTEIKDALGQTTRYAYTAPCGWSLYLPSEMTRPDGVVIAQRFDREGRIVETSDGVARTTRYAYGAFDQLVGITDATGGTTSFEYDVWGHLRCATNAAGARHELERDLAGRIVVERDFHGRRTSYRRDNAGRVVEQINADGSRLTFAYDRLGAMIERRAQGANADGLVLQDREIFRYDGRGSIVSAHNGTGETSFDYDKAGQLVRERGPAGAVEIAYDDGGRRSERTVGGCRTSYEYDAVGATRSVTVTVDGKSVAVLFERDALGRETERRLGAFRLSQTLDAVGRIVRQASPSTSEAAAESSLDRRFTWNGASAPVAIADTVWGRTTYIYDDRGWLAEVRHDEGLPPPAPDAVSGVAGLPGDGVEVERFRYSPAGDIVASDCAVPGDPLGRDLTSWTFGRDGRVLSAPKRGGGRVLLRYDDNGRVVERSVVTAGNSTRTWTFSWNALDRLISCRTPTGALWSYAYDPFGRRVSKHGEASGRRELYIWDGDHVAAVTVQPDHDADPVPMVVWVREPQTDHPILQHDAKLTSAFMVVTDPLGTPRELFDEAGKRRWSRSAAAWGGDRRSWDDVRDADTIDCPLRFPGQLADPESGLYYNRHRYYDPDCMQYLCADPTALNGGYRPNGYVSCPTTHCDVLGLAPKTQLPNGATAIADPNAAASSLGTINEIALANQGANPSGLTPLYPGSEFVPSVT